MPLLRVSKVRLRLQVQAQSEMILGIAHMHGTRQIQRHGHTVPSNIGKKGVVT